MSERILVTGASGLLGSSVALNLFRRGVDTLGVIRSSAALFPFQTVRVDLRDSIGIREVVLAYRPTAILHAAALSKVLECEQNPDAAYECNVKVTELLLECAGEVKSNFIFLSTDQVFGGERGNYSEEDVPEPTHVYGKSKYEAEKLVSQADSTFLIARSNNIVGRNVGWGKSFSDGLLEKLQIGQSITLFVDQYRSPIHLRTITHSLCNCIEQRISGVLHLGGPEKLSRFDTGRQLSEAYSISNDLVNRASMSSHPQAHSLHKDGTFDTKKFSDLFPELGKSTILDGFRLDSNSVPHL